MEILNLVLLFSLYYSIKQLSWFLYIIFIILANFIIYLLINKKQIQTKSSYNFKYLILFKLINIIVLFNSVIQVLYKNILKLPGMHYLYTINRMYLQKKNKVTQNILNYNNKPNNIHKKDHVKKSVFRNRKALKKFLDELENE